ncbi:MAG: ATP-binding cassette domain-containing protein [Thiolinea sp.]
MGRQTRAIQKQIGYLPENCPVWPEMTVLDYLVYQAGLQGVPTGQQREAVARAVRRTALKDKATQPIHTLSRGYRQRVGVAQAILHDPAIIILDEPTNGLDPTQIRQMRSLITELAQSATVMISTHILQEVQAVCERALIMRAGKLVLDARLDELQAGHRLTLVLDNGAAAAYLRQVAGVKAVESQPLTEPGRSAYLLEADAAVAPHVAAAVQAAGDRLYRLQPEIRNLETVFAEVNREAA